MTAAAVGWGDPGADPPEEWHRTRERLADAEVALSGMVAEVDELRRVLRRVREYAQHLHLLADVEGGDSRASVAYRSAAVGLERTIGDRP